RTLFVDFHEVYCMIFDEKVIFMMFVSIKLSSKINKQRPDPFGLAGAESKSRHSIFQKHHIIFRRQERACAQLENWERFKHGCCCELKKTDSRLQRVWG
ncbi:MAG: hypothetical protein LBI02_07860, partial [Opitutaceae bacterium]|nr:hypothetical protein [Opitutaceae bacterium]